MTYPVSYNIDYYTGDTYQFFLRPKIYNYTTEQYDDVDLTQYNSLFVIATERGNPSAVVYSSSPQISASTYLLCAIPPSAGMYLTGASYVYDVEIKNKTDVYDVLTIVTGTISTLRDIS